MVFRQIFTKIILNRIEQNEISRSIFILYNTATSFAQTLSIEQFLNIIRQKSSGGEPF